MGRSDVLLVFNGINGATGRYDIEPTPVDALARLALGMAPHSASERAHFEELRRRRQRDTQTNYAPKEGVDPKKLEESGWGVIFAYGADPAIYEALSPLLKLRKLQAGERYREYMGAKAYRGERRTHRQRASRIFCSATARDRGLSIPRWCRTT